ncbi:helix-turn-helix domain-containing protein [Amycolatopsis cihanbeyliensis]|uniref:Helix-turn-helix protein n=1 Tax=Amycolatopsis cihanbeyliensis TaxID=1128664 RepID=A0A542DNV2_AMYCI|nr:helix-turn-helix transcriptional regulator [Amycolatopsis cihanbeyliensis]TQJ04645.1 helix-turn-helix protein [Amycolatopsis cihanbeyliensis]
MTSADTPGPGKNVAILRKARDMSQAKLAREAGVSVSLLSKIEVGDRALNQGVAAALARAMGVGLNELLGQTRIQEDNDELLKQLRSTIRRFDLPGEPPNNPEILKSDLVELTRLRSDAKLREVLEKTPGLLAKATNFAHANGSPEAWAMVADIYSTIYWLAARHRWMDLADLAVLKQHAAAERANPLLKIVAARDEAGAFLNSGDFAGGLAIIERAVVQAEKLNGRDRALGLGLLHLRGLTLAGRAGDKKETERHIAAAWRVAEEFSEDVDVHGIHFGPENTAIHQIATTVDLEQHRTALDTMESLTRRPLTLPATRIGPLHMNVARAKLALGNRDDALESLVSAWEVAPQMSKVHPTSRELMRVLISLHKRSNPTLTKLAQRAGVTI